METMYERIKRMTFEEMREFIYWVYQNGNRDGQNNLEDSPYISYFGGMMLEKEAKEVMPNDDVKNDLWDLFEQVYGN